MNIALIVMKKTAKSFKLIPLSKIDKDGSEPLEDSFSSFFRYRVEIILELLTYIGKKQDLETLTIQKLYNLMTAEKEGSRFTYDDCSFLPAVDDDIPARILVKHPC